VHNWENIPPKFDIFPLQNIRTAIVFVANTHARVSQTRTAHAQAGKMDFPCGFSQHRGKTSAHAPNYENMAGNLNINF
jgi:hypothetical protein